MRVRHRGWSGLLPLLLLVAAATTSAGIERDPAGAIPPVLFTSLPHVDPAYPTFVAASTAVSAEGEVNTGLFHPDVVRGLESLFDNEPANGCIELGPVYWERTGSLERGTLSQAAETSHVTIVGRVVARGYGFRFEEAGQLFEIEVDDVLRGQASREHYFYFHPVAEFEAGPYRICKTDFQYPIPPEIGDRVVLMVPQELHDPEEPFLDLVTPEGVVVLPKQGEPRLPWRFKQGDEKVRRLPSTAADVLDVIRRKSNRTQDAKP